MEWAILTPDADALALVDAVQNGAPPADAGPEWAAVAACRGRAPFSRLYFGSEFCERRLPSPQDLRAALAVAAERDMQFTLVTPYVSPAGIQRVRTLLGTLTAGRSDAEVLVNDWGVLHTLRAGGHTCPAVLGRLMSRMIRDPRVADFYDVPDAPAGALAALRKSSISAKAYRQVLSRYNVGRVELDNLIQGFDLDFARLEVAGSLHLPYGVVATTRHCMIGSLHLPRKLKFAPGPPCRQECQHYTLAMDRNGARPARAPQRPMWLKGNTVFYGQDPELIRSGYARAEASGISRIVYHPTLPL